MNDYKDTTDEELVRRFRDGDKELSRVLIDRYSIQVRRLAAPLYLIGGDKEDLIQEGHVGLYDAILHYDPAKYTSFATFANLCIRRAQYKAIDSSNRKKHRPLNFRISMDELEGDGADGKRQPVDESLNPEAILLGRERAIQMYDAIRKGLSPMELTVLNHYLDGMDYTVIAAKLGKDKKSIDNAIQRIRRKVKKICSKDF